MPTAVAKTAPNGSGVVRAHGYDDYGHPQQVDAGGREGDDNDDDEDWLMSDDECIGETTITNGSRTEAADVGDDMTGLEMASRDSAKVKRVFYDTGYREGITSGKLSTLQSGFDEGFNQSAPIGRLRGNLRGQASAVQIYLTEYNQQKKNQPNPRGASSVRSRANVNISQDGRQRADAHAQTTRGILSEVQSLNVDNLLPPDWEAKRHELEHRDGQENVNMEELKETEDQKRTRMFKLGEIKERLDAVTSDVLR